MSPPVLFTCEGCGLQGQVFVLKGQTLPSDYKIPTRCELCETIAKAKEARDAMTGVEKEKMLQAQRESWVRGEMAMGSDADEARYRAQLEEGHHETLREDVRRNGT